MSRAVQLTRPDPTPNDLLKTAESIVKSLILPTPVNSEVKRKLKDLCEAYEQFCKDQIVKNFHGLRDFYGVCKQYGMFLKARKGHHRESDLLMSILRNFGGQSRPLRQTAFRRFFPNRIDSTEPSPKELLLANLKDKHSRHLLIITKGLPIVCVM